MESFGGYVVDMRRRFCSHLARGEGRGETAETASSSPKQNVGSTDTPCATAILMKPVRVRTRTSEVGPSPVSGISSMPPGKTMSELPFRMSRSQLALPASTAPKRSDISRTIGMLNSTDAPSMRNGRWKRPSVSAERQKVR